MAGTVPALVATDLDRTLLRDDGTASDRTQRALQLVEDRGATVVFVTARPPRWMHDLTDLVGEHGLAVCANGGFVYDVAERRIIDQFPLDVPTVTEMARLLRAEVPGLAFAVENAAGFGHEPEYWSEYAMPPGTPVGELADLLTAPPVKVLARHRDLDVDELYSRAVDAVGHLVELSHSGAAGLLEIAARGVSKATGLSMLCEQLGVQPAQVVAFGDMPNDIPMLTWAGTSYAVANAHPQVRACATRVVGSNNDDGVARTLEQIYAE